MIQCAWPDCYRQAQRAIRWRGLAPSQWSLWRPLCGKHLGPSRVSATELGYSPEVREITEREVAQAVAERLEGTT